MFHVQQHINIGSIKIDSISNSSMLQVGTSGGMNALANVHQHSAPGFPMHYFDASEFFSPTLVPLPNPNS